MDTLTVKTTVEIDRELFYKAKRKALDEKKSLKDIINSGLAKELKVPEKHKLSREEAIKKYAGVWKGETGEKIAKAMEEFRKDFKLLRSE